MLCYIVIQLNVYTHDGQYPTSDAQNTLLLDLCVILKFNLKAKVKKEGSRQNFDLSPKDGGKN